MNRIKELRTAHGIKQIDLCKKLGITQGALSGWENGKYEPDNLSLIKMADIFEVSVDYLLGRKDTPKLPEISEDDNGLIFSIEGNTEKIELSPGQIEKAREILRVTMPEQFNQKDE